MRCKTCHYSLKGLGETEHRCPECGRAFDPNDPRTVDLGGVGGTMSPAARAAIRIAIWAVVLLGLLTGIVAIYIYYSFEAAFRNFRP